MTRTRLRRALGYLVAYLFMVVVVTPLMLFGYFVEARRPAPPFHGRPIIDQKVLAEHRKLFGDTQNVPTTVEGRRNLIEAIENLGLPKWRGRWTK